MAWPHMRLGLVMLPHSTLTSSFTIATLLHKSMSLILFFGERTLGKTLIKAVFVLASNHFRKSFSIKPCVWLHMENRIFRICISFYHKKKPLTRKLFYISIFTSNHFRTKLQTRKEREREKRWARIDRALVWRPQTELQSDDQYRTDRTGLVNHSTAPIK